MIRLAVRVPRDSSELVLAELIDLAPSGIEERDVPENAELIEYAMRAHLLDAGPAST